MSGLEIAGIVAIVAYAWMVLATALMFWRVAIDRKEEEGASPKCLLLGLMWPVIWFALTAGVFADWARGKTK